MKKAVSKQAKVNLQKKKGYRQPFLSRRDMALDSDNDRHKEDFEQLLDDAVASGDRPGRASKG